MFFSLSLLNLKEDCCVICQTLLICQQGKVKDEVFETRAASRAPAAA